MAPRFGELARTRFGLSEEAVSRALEEQERLSARGERRPLGQLLQAQGALSWEQAREILREQGKAILACPACSRRYLVTGTAGGDRLFCSDCGAVLANQGGADLSAGSDRPAASLASPPSKERVAPRETVVLAPSPSASAPLPPGTPLASSRGAARYRRIVEIAEGGMGKVFLVQDAEFGRSVVMKVLHANRRDPDSVRRFLNEARITARLEHPNIVPVYDQSVTEDGLPYFTMKMVRGVDLGEIIAARRKGEVRYSLIRILQVFQSICDAIGYAHAQGIIHRDLKPENVMHGDYGEVFVMDWGLAREISASEEAHPLSGLPAAQEGGRTLDGVVVGTPAYMPPEQARGEHAAMSARSDIYSLGAILYEILTREQPYQGKDAHDIIAQIIAGAPRPPRGIDPEIPPGLEAICLKAMERLPEERYASAAGMSEDIQRYVEGQSVSAEALTRWKRGMRFLRRHTRTLRSVSFLLLCLAGMFAALFWLEAAWRSEERSGGRIEAQARAFEHARQLRHEREEAARTVLDEAASVRDPGTALALLDRAEALTAGLWREVPLVRGRLFLASGRPTEAVAAFDEALRRSPSDVPSLRARASARRQAGDPRGAAADLAEAERIHPTRCGEKCREAEALLRDGKPDQALLLLEEAKALDPDSPRARRILALALCQAGRAAQAEPVLRECVREDPGNIQAACTLGDLLAAQGDGAGVLAAYASALEADPGLFQPLQARAGRAFALSPASALQAFTAILVRHPEATIPWTDEALRALGDRIPPAWHDADRLLTSLLAQDQRPPLRSALLLRRAWVRGSEGLLTEMLQDCEAWTSCGPPSEGDGALEGLADHAAYALAGDFANGLEPFARFLERHPGMLLPWTQEALEAFAGKQPPLRRESTDLLARMLEACRDPKGDPHQCLLYWRARGAQEEGRHTDALADYDRLLPLAADKPVVHYHRIRALMACARSAEALQALDAMEKAFPRLPGREMMEAVRALRAGIEKNLPEHRVP